MVARKSAAETSWPKGMRSSPSSITMRPFFIPARRLRTAPRAKRSMIAGRRARAASTPDVTMESALAIGFDYTSIASPCKRRGEPPGKFAGEGCAPPIPLRPPRRVPNCWIVFRDAVILRNSRDASNSREHRVNQPRAELTQMPSSNPLKYVLAIDMGSGSTKAAVVSSAGDVVASALRQTTTKFMAGGAVEQDPEEWWRAVCDAAKEAIAASRVPVDRIISVACTTLWAVTVAVDEDGAAIGNAISWMDTRG